MEKNEILELETRRRIYNFILNYPGLHFRELSRKISMPKSTLEYHLRYLKKRGLVTATSKGKYARYYIAKKVGVDTKKLFDILRQETPRRILLSMKIYHPVSLEHLVRDLDKASSTISYHLKKLIDADIVERIKVDNQVKFGLKDEEGLYDFFIQYNESLLDEFVISLVNWITHVRTDVSFRELIGCIHDTDALIRGLYEIFPHPYHA